MPRRFGRPVATYGGSPPRITKRAGASTFYMTRKLSGLIILAVCLAGLSLYFNRDWFAKDDIQIYDRSRPVRAGFVGTRRIADSAVDPIVFGFNRMLRLKSVKVVPVAALTTNKYAHPIWHLVSDSNSVPTRSFSYGMRIRGMHPAVKGAAPDPLEPSVTYRLFIEAGKTKAEHDFTTVPRTP